VIAVRKALKKLSYTLTPPTPLAPPPESTKAVVENWPELKGRAFMVAFKRGLPEGFSALASFLEVEKGLNVIHLTTMADGPLREGLAFTLPYALNSVVDSRRGWLKRLCLLSLCRNPKPWALSKPFLWKKRPLLYFRPSLLFTAGAASASLWLGYAEALPLVAGAFPLLLQLDRPASIALSLAGVDWAEVERKRREEAELFSCSALLEVAE